MYRLATPNLIASVVSASVLWWFLHPERPGLWAACKAMLDWFECEVDVAENGRLGVEAAFGRRCDIVLMDCQTAEMDGFEATAAIRAREAQATGNGDPSDATRLPIVALTANAMAGDRERCLAARMDDYLSKPYNRQQLADLIARRIGGASKERALIA